MTLRLVPKILDLIDTIFAIHEGYRMDDTIMLENTNIQNIVADSDARIDDDIEQKF